jgi:two-component system, NarL family, response regulator DevR
MCWIRRFSRAAQVARRYEFGHHPIGDASASRLIEIDSINPQRRCWGFLFGKRCWSAHIQNVIYSQRPNFLQRGISALNKHLRIIIVDDHEVVRLGLRALLEKQPGFTVVDEAGNAKEAVQKALQHRPEVVVLDIRLPGGSGIDACREIVTAAPEVKVIMLTSFAEDDMLFEAIAAGASGYVLKQIGGDDLVRAIEAVGRGDSLLDPTLTQRVFARVREAQRKDEQSAFSQLTEQEMRVLGLVAEGKTNREIAQQLFLGEGTVRNYVSSILSKLALTNRAEAAAYAVQHNIRAYLNESSG